MSKTGADNRAYGAAHFGLELDGNKQLAMFRSVEGGAVKADVMVYHHAINKDTGYNRYRQLGRPKFDDIKMQVGMSMSKPLYEWLQDFLVGKPTRKNGAIVAADFHFKERARRTFTNALIKELTFPKLEGKDTHAAYMTVALAIEDMAFEAGGGAAISFSGNPDNQRLWTAKNFRLNIDGLPGSTRCTKIDSFTIKQQIIEYPMGGFKNAQKTPSVLEFPNISFYIPEADAEPFIKHMQQQVGFGGSGNGKVRDPASLNGHLDIFDNDQKKNVIFSLNFYGAEIVSATPDKHDADSTEAKQVRIEMFTERMEFFYPALEVE